MKLTKYVLVEEDHTTMAHVEEAVKRELSNVTVTSHDPTQFSTNLRIEGDDVIFTEVSGGETSTLLLSTSQLYALAELIRIHETHTGNYSDSIIYKEVSDG